MRIRTSLILLASLITLNAFAQGRRGGGQGGGPGGGDGVGPSAASFESTPIRSIGPAVVGGRINDIIVDPTRPSKWIIGVASGGVWITENAGATWTPTFENQGSYSIGAIAMDPRNPNNLWVGTGECNAQRSVGYGDGIYKSEDGGRTWRNIGLKQSGNIGRIAVDPRNSDVVYVAAQGPLWSPGGERGLYKTTDGGKTWNPVLTISENTGVTEVVLDPKNPDVVFAASWQRRRHVFTYIGGGPESGIHRSTDGGKTWTKLRGGLPPGDLGRIGMTFSPADPNLIYATVEAGGGGAGEEGGPSAGGLSGTYASTNGGTTWERRGTFVAQGMYYGQIVGDPKDANRVYILNVQTMVSNDGGRTVQPVGERNKHVDNHAIWIDPANTSHLLGGCDGGLYESFDRGATWHFSPNLPISQFYRIAVDDATPFYNVYGGTQDNGSLGGPSRTRGGGIANSDWYVTLGGDGFHQAVEPGNPNIVYSILQHGVLSRLDRRTGERVGIKPVEGKGEAPLRWNWDSPLVISPHSPARLYVAANRLYRSDDRGSHWTAISPDLTRQIDRNKLPVMGRVQKLDAVARGQSTSFYGNIVSLAESPHREGVLFVGCDDGLIQITEDAGKTWRKIERIDGVPTMAYVSRLLPSKHDANTLYACFDNHKNGDFKPYVMKSTDLGKTWSSVAGNLPENGSVLSLVEDHVTPGLLFCGTEFGLFYTLDGGKAWRKFRSLPTIPVRDLAIQRRESDLVIGTFGRGIYILDDYSAMRDATPENLAKGAYIFPIKTVTDYNAYSPHTGSQGETFFLSPSPSSGVTITYSIKDTIRTMRQKRQAADREAERGGQTPPFPTPEQLRAEAQEDAPSATLIITDKDGNVVRRVPAQAGAGLHRTAWDLRMMSVQPVSAEQPGGAGGGRGGRGGGGFGGGGGFRAMPGEYSVTLNRKADGKTTTLAGPVKFAWKAEGDDTLKPDERKVLLVFREKVAKLQRAFGGASEVARSLVARAATDRRALANSPKATDKLLDQAEELEKAAEKIVKDMFGDGIADILVEAPPVTISDRIQSLSAVGAGSASQLTGTRQEQYAIAAEEFGGLLERLRKLVRTDLERMEREMDKIGAPHTPGRLPEWKDG